MTPRRDPLIIGLVGRAGAGKDTVADRLCDKHGFERHAFAEPIKDMLTALLTGIGVDYAHLFERHLKESPVPGLGISGRRLMQTLGTEWGRSLDPDLWVKAAAMTLGLHDLPASSPIHDRLVITDVRFPNEAAWLQSMGANLIRVWRETPDVATHESEQHVNSLPCELCLLNNGTVNNLYDQVDDLVADLLSRA